MHTDDFDDPAEVLLSLSHPGLQAPAGPDAPPAPASTSARFHSLWATTAGGAHVPNAPGWTYDDTPPSFVLLERFGFAVSVAGIVAVAAVAWFSAH